jgi:glucose-6-phosphate 1-dehydrogenase
MPAKSGISNNRTLLHEEMKMTTRDIGTIMADFETFQNPLEDQTCIKMPAPCVLVIFGATGDLTARRLLPALYNLALEGQLPSHFACVGFARREKTDSQFRDEMFNAVNEHSRTQPIDHEVWQTFSEQLFYHRSEFDNDEGYRAFAEKLKSLDATFGTKGNRVYYFSTPPSHFPTIVQKLKLHGLLYDQKTHPTRFSRIVIEKPFGHDLPTALDLQHQMAAALDENQMYRIDHWLGKETVQNLLVLRFANAIFEPIWNNKYIDHVQITVAENDGVGTRGRFYEEAGALRDIVQNHMMQLLSLVAMEPPVNLSGDSVREEKVKVLSSIRPIRKDQVEKYSVRGQYSQGFINGEPVAGYRQEANVSPTSPVETYIAMQLFVDNWRWAGVPFFLRAGKRLPKRTTEIAVFFKEAPNVLFNAISPNEKNALVFRIQPDEGICVKINSKVPGGRFLLQPVKMDFRYSSYFGTTPPEAYERLLCDCMLGDQTLFARQDEVLASWGLLQPILEHWQSSPPTDFPNYPAGTWGPEEANKMIHREGRIWRLT